MVEVYLRFSSCIDCMEPVVKHDMILRGDFSGVKTQYEGNRLAVVQALTHVDASRRPGLPPRELVSICNGVVQYVHWTSPYMNVLKLGEWPRLATEQFEWRPPGIFSWYTVE